jgi:hypothetical protein
LEPANADVLRCTVVRAPAARTEGMGVSSLEIVGPDGVIAHTSPVYVQVGGQPVHRSSNAAWRLDWLDRFEALIMAEGHFAEDGQRDDVLGLIDRARPFYRERTIP